MLFNEPKLLKPKRSLFRTAPPASFSALQRAEIAETLVRIGAYDAPTRVSVLFNEPKLLKQRRLQRARPLPQGFSALQRAEIAETVHL